MNPFASDSQFDPRLYEIISRIGKKSDRTKLKGLDELVDALDDIDVDTNIETLVDTIAETISSQNAQIRTRSIDVLYKLLSRTEERVVFKGVLSTWLYGFVRNPGCDTSKRMFAEYIDLRVFEDEFVKLLNFEEEPILGLRCLLLLIRKGTGDYSETFRQNIVHLKLNSIAELTGIYRICKLVGGPDELLDKVVGVNVPTMMNLKWRILVEVFETIPKCIVEDGKYLDPEVLALVTNDVECCDDIKVRSAACLRTILPKVRNRREYSRDYLNNGPVEDLCVFELCSDIRFLDENVEFEVVNGLVRNALKKHFGEVEKVHKHMSKLSISCGPMLNRGYEVKDTVEHVCSSCTPEDNAMIFETLLSSLHLLSGEKKIVRGSILEAKLTPEDFTIQEIENVFPYSVDVFPMEYMLNTSFDCDQLLLVLKYPNEIGEERIKKIVNRSNLSSFIPVCNDLEFLRSLIFVYEDSVLLDLYSADIPPGLDVDFYYRLRKRIHAPRMVDYNRLLNVYLDDEFIEELIVCGVVDRSLLFDAVLLYLSSLDIPINTSYTASFYDLDECFYNNVEVKESNPCILKLAKLYVRVYNSQKDLFIILLLGAICGDEDGTLDMLLRNRGIGGKVSLMKMLEADSVDKLGLVDLRGNQHFVEKVLLDLDLQSKNCSSKSLEELLRGGGLRVIDYVIRNSEVPAQLIPFIDFSYLSNAALANVVGILESVFGCGISVDFTELSSSHDKSDVGGSELDARLSFIEDDDFLRSLVSSDFRNLRGLNLDDLIKMIEKDRVLLKKEFYRERLEIYSVILANVYRKVADSVFNAYSISRIDPESVDGEVYDLLRGCFLGSKLLFWDILLNSLVLIRNVSINSFLERMVEEREEWVSFLESATIEQKSLFAFVFPNIFSTLPRMKIYIDPLIIEEASKHVAGVVVKAQKLTNGFNIKISYMLDETPFKASISIPTDYPYKKPTFSSEIGKKSLLNLKINEMIRRNSRFMELVSLWKINIDEKIAGHKECPICYLILDVHDSSLPGNQCATCKNKFHARCIAKWVFSSARTRSTCPMCRSPIDRE